MPKATTRKVTKVARTGGGRTKRGQTSWFFPAVIAVTVVLGTSLIVFSRTQRQPDTSPPRVGLHHWHSAIGFNICGQFVANVADNGADPLGIHTHSDGVIHTHPFSSQAAGRNAKLSVFLDTLDITATSSQLKLPGEDSAHRNGDDCNGQTARVVTKVWDSRSPDDDGRTVSGNPGDIRLGDRQLITIAFVPEGMEILKPPSEAQLDNLSDVPGATTTLPPSTTVPGETTTTSPPTTAAAPTTAVP